MRLVWGTLVLVSALVINWSAGNVNAAGDLANEAEATAVAAVGFAGAAHAVEGREDGDALSGTNMKCEQQPCVNGWARLASQGF